MFTITKIFKNLYFFSFPVFITFTIILSFASFGNLSVRAEQNEENSFERRINITREREPKSDKTEDTKKPLPQTSAEERKNLDSLVENPAVQNRASGLLKKIKGIKNSNFQYLDVPYFNQCLEQNGVTFSLKNLNSDNKEVCRYMCSGASMVMIGGYFRKLNYDKKDSSTLKKYMYSDSGQNIIESCGENQSGAYGLIAKETDKFTGGETQCNSGSDYGMGKYAEKIGLFTKNIDINLASIKASIDRKNPVILSTPSHIFVVKGYLGDKLIINDPYRDLSINNSDYSLNGQNALYSMEGVYYKGEIENFIYAFEVSNKSLINPVFSVDQKINTTIDGLSVRPNPCDSIRTARVPANSKGVILDKKITENCQFGTDFKVWYKVRFESGVEGWVVENYLEKA